MLLTKEELCLKLWIWTNLGSWLLRFQGFDMYNKRVQLTSSSKHWLMASYITLRILPYKIIQGWFTVGNSKQTANLFCEVR